MQSKFLKNKTIVYIVGAAMLNFCVRILYLYGMSSDIDFLTATAFSLFVVILPAAYGIFGYLLFKNVLKTIVVAYAGILIAAITLVLVNQSHALIEFYIILFQFPELLITYSEIKSVLKSDKKWNKASPFIIMKLIIVYFVGSFSYAMLSWDSMIH